MKKRIRKTRAEQQAETRAHLIEAAQTVFARMGYHGSSIELIAAEAGYTKGAVYSNFESKEELFLELLRSCMEKDLTEIERIVELDPDDMYAAHSRWLQHIHSALPDLPGMVTELQLHARRSPEFAKAFYPLQNRKMEVIARIIEKFFAASGQKPPLEAKELAYVTEALIHGLSIQQPIRGASDLNEAGAIVDRLMKVLAGRPLDTPNA